MKRKLTEAQKRAMIARKTSERKQTSKQSSKPTSKPKKKAAQKRTSGGRVPQGRTLTTRDNYLGNGKRTGSTKTRPVVVIEANEDNDLAVVPLSSREGKNRTRLRRYQQGQSYFKHYVEIEDDEGKPIRVNEKFKENHPNMDVSRQDVEKIKDKVLNKSYPAAENRKKMDKFRGKKK